MERVKGGQLTSAIWNKEIILTEEDARKVMSSLMGALSYLHQRDIVHRDIKPCKDTLSPTSFIKNIKENILIKDKEDIASIKLCDFGLSAKYNINSNFALSK